MGRAPRAVKFARAGLVMAAFRDIEEVSQGLLSLLGANRAESQHRRLLGRHEQLVERLLEAQDSGEQRLREILAAEEEVARSLLDAKERAHRGGAELQQLDAELQRAAAEDAGLQAGLLQLSRELQELKETEAELERQEREVDEDVTVTIPAAVPPRPQRGAAHPPGQHSALQEVHQRLPLEPGGHLVVAGSAAHRPEPHGCVLPSLPRPGDPRAGGAALCGVPSSVLGAGPPTPPHPSHTQVPPGRTGQVSRRPGVTGCLGFRGEALILGGCGHTDYGMWVPRPPEKTGRC
nr:kinetochore protein Spc24 isoform X2 [Oryctolagus cuniculus]